MIDREMLTMTLGVSSTSATGASALYPWKPKGANATNNSEVQVLQKEIQALSKQLKEAWKTAGERPIAHAQVVMLTSQIMSLQQDITNITNGSSAIASSENARAEMLRTVAAVDATDAANGGSDSDALTAKVGLSSLSLSEPTESSSGASQGSSRSLRFDLTGSVIDTVA